jgi:hypothetical protein
LGIHKQCNIKLNLTPVIQKLPTFGKIKTVANLRKKRTIIQVRKQKVARRKKKEKRRIIEAPTSTSKGLN